MLCPTSSCCTTKVHDSSGFWMTSQQDVINHFKMLVRSIQQNEEGSAQQFDDDFWDYVDYLKRTRVQIYDPQLRQVLRAFPRSIFRLVDRCGCLGCWLCCTFCCTPKVKHTVPKSSDDIAYWIMCVIVGLSTWQCRPIIIRPVFIQSSFIYPLDNTFRIAVVADVGSNDIHHKLALQAIKSQNPDAIIHLGDIYASGLPDECELFWQMYEEIFGPNAQKRTPLWAIPGNHEYVCGLKGFREELLSKGRLGKDGCQTNTCFALRNQFVQLLGIDTARCAQNFEKIPGLVPEDTFDSSLTKLEDEEALWVQSRLKESPSTIMLSHHQYFSHTWAAHNPNFKLKNQIGTDIAKVKLWLWGHEHQFFVYKSPNPRDPKDKIYGGLIKGRCIGNGAMPNLVSDKPYDVDFQQRTTCCDCFVSYEDHIDEGVPRLDTTWSPPSTSKDQGTGEEVYNCGFAMLEMNNPGSLIARYFEVPWNATKQFGYCKEVFREAIMLNQGQLTRILPQGYF